MKVEYTLMAQMNADGRWRGRVWNRKGYFEPDVEVFDTALEVLEWGQQNFGRLDTMTEIQWELVYER
jgi:hypothetical protein